MQHIPLHVHTEYSLLDGASKIPDLISRAKELNMSGLAITDHGVMFGCYEMLVQCRKAGIKPILGSEIYVMNGDHKNKSVKLPIYHLVLLAKNNIGYKNLVKIVSEANIHGFYYKPRVSKEFLKDYSEGLICLSACLAGEIDTQILNNDILGAEKTVKFYKEIFGEDFYLEIQDHCSQEDQIANAKIIEIAKKFNCKVVATNDSHYTLKEDARAHDALLCLQTNKLVSEFPRMHFSGNEYLKSAQEMFDSLYYLDQEEVKQAIEDNTLEILNKIEDYDILLNTYNRLPKIPVPEGETNESYLIKLTKEKIKERYIEITPEIEKRLNYELEIIVNSGFSGYFLVVADFIDFARKNKIPVGPGRGSAAGSIVAYILGITNIDPLRFNLLFERFLNPERKSMPDIDTDFCIERRGEIIDYVRKLYGEEKVAQIVTFNRLTSKAVIKDVARVLNYPYSKAETLAKSIPVERGKPKNLDWMVENHPEFKEIYETDELAHEVIDLARKIENTNKSYGVHAAGVIISDENLTEIVPLIRGKEGESTVTQYAMNESAELGLLKMDFLGLRNLTNIYKALDIIKDSTGDEINIDEVSFDDPKVYEMLSRGELSGIFQLETSGGMRQVARDMKPNCIEDISAIIALYRPGPLDTGMIDEFIDRKQGRKKIEYKTPELESILKDTYGTIVYQEQIMQIAQKLAGFTLGQADLLRRAMGKKKPEEMMKYKEIFLNGAAERNIKAEVAQELFEMMVAFAAYCFNKSHSAAYALISYQTAWLKANYPVQYLTALMSSASSDQDKIKFYINEAQRLGIEVQAPNINLSGADFTADSKNKKILFGLNAVKNLGEAAVKNIIKVRKEGEEFKSIIDFCQRVDLRVVNKKSLESLILCGAMNDLTKGTRKGLFESIDRAISEANKLSLGQGNLFSLVESGDSFVENLNTEEFTKTEMNRFEKEYLGFYVSGHPLMNCGEEINYFSSKNLSEIGNLPENSQITVPILLTKLTKRMTKTNKLMAVGEGEDLTSKIELVFFAKVLEEYGELLQEEALLLINGKVQSRGEGNFSIVVNSVQDLKELNYLEINLLKKKEIEDFAIQNIFINLRDLLKKHEGSSPVILFTGKYRLLLNNTLWTDNSKNLLEKINSKDFFKAEIKSL